MNVFPFSRWTAFRTLVLVVVLVVTAVGCSDQAELTSPEAAGDPSLAAGAPTGVAALVDRVNARLEQTSSPARLGSVTFFTIGRGVPEFRLLRTGFRWTYTDLTYLIDESDFTTDVSAALVDAALVASFESWDQVPNVTLDLQRIPDTFDNPDLLDAVVRDTTGACVDVIDVTFPGLDLQAGTFEPVADIVFGGWLPAEYFEDCLGSDLILGTTYLFFGPDSDGDRYADLIYAEMFYNEGFDWTTTEAVYLDFSAPIDIQSVVMHEVGHTLGLHHFGGPNENQPFKVRPNGRVFSPEAVMNAFYVGGEQHALFPTDIAGLRTLYARGGSGR